MDKTFYEILGIEKAASHTAVLEAFRELVRQHHPDKFKEPAEKAAAEVLLKDITEAFNTLYNARKREEYDKTLLPGGSATHVKSSQEQAKEFFQQGMARYKAGELSQAVSLFDMVLRVQPDHSAALFYGGIVKMRNPKWRSQGAEAVERAIGLEPYNAAYVVEYCRLLIAMGQSIRATKILDKAAVEFHAGKQGSRIHHEFLVVGVYPPGRHKRR